MTCTSNCRRVSEKRLEISGSVEDCFVSLKRDAQILVFNSVVIPVVFLHINELLSTIFLKCNNFFVLMQEIPPFETKSIMKASFIGRIENNHTAFIRIKTNKDNKQEMLILPVEVEVTSGLQNFLLTSPSFLEIFQILINDIVVPIFTGI